MLNKKQKKILKNWKKRCRPYLSKTIFYQLKKHFDIEFFAHDESGVWYKVFNKNKTYWLATIAFNKNNW